MLRPFKACRLILPLVVAIASILAGGGQSRALTTLIDFEELTFPADPLHYSGSPSEAGFSSGGATFNNHFTDYGGGCCWEGFAYSRETQIPPLETSTFLWQHQYTSITGSGANGSNNYAVAFSGFDAGEGGVVPRIGLPEGASPLSMQVTNNAFAALSMRNGDGFAKKFGGVEGDDPDWFRLRAIGLDASEEVTGEVELYLADFRGPASEDYILNEWVTLDLTPLGAPRFIALRFDSSDNDPVVGMNTPAYAAIDNLVLSVPMSGDYNGDGVVDAADYTVWRNTLGSTDDLRADGDNSGTIDTGDYVVWKGTFGTGSGGAGLHVSVVPEPSSLVIVACGALLSVCLVKRIVLFRC